MEQFNASVPARFLFANYPQPAMESVMPNTDSDLALALAYIEKEGRRRPARWKAPNANEIKQIREGLGLTQEQFSARYGLSLVSLRKWEQNRATPEQAAIMVLRMIEVSPEVTGSILDKARESPTVLETS